MDKCQTEIRAGRHRAAFLNKINRDRHGMTDTKGGSARGQAARLSCVMYGETPPVSTSIGHRRHRGGRETGADGPAETCSRSRLAADSPRPRAHRRLAVRGYIDQRPRDDAVRRMYVRTASTS